MILYLIRHADAVSRETPGFDDDGERPLTDRGHAQARQLGLTLLHLGVKLDAIVTSPLVRAVQTTDGMLATWAKKAPPVEPFDEIGEKMRPRRVVKFLEKQGAESAAIVGHEPMLSEFAAWLIGSKKARMTLEKAGFARIDCETLGKGGGVLTWLITPAWCAGESRNGVARKRTRRAVR